MEARLDRDSWKKDILAPNDIVYASNVTRATFRQTVQLNGSI